MIRVMTNTPALVDQAMSAISAGPHATGEHLALAEEMFRPLGATIRVPEASRTRSPRCPAPDRPTSTSWSRR